MKPHTAYLALALLLCLPALPASPQTGEPGAGAGENAPGNTSGAQAEPEGGDTSLDGIGGDDLDLDDIDWDSLTVFYAGEITVTGT
ncbi:MAG: hypothetical protein LBQ38_08335, partial [Spirochaetaceae bacterium]|nr:hypothetical protein [Spirochaetaceae bacterium]